MQKKHRKIVVDGQSYGYVVARYGESVNIYQDKKVIYHVGFGSDNTVTPSLVAELIREKRKMSKMVIDIR